MVIYSNITPKMIKKQTTAYLKHTLVEIESDIDHHVEDPKDEVEVRKKMKLIREEIKKRRIPLVYMVVKYLDRGEKFFERMVKIVGKKEDGYGHSMDGGWEDGDISWTLTKKRAKKVAPRLRKLGDVTVSWWNLSKEEIDEYLEESEVTSK